PFLVGDHAEEALIPDYLGAGNVLDRALVHSGRYRAGDRGTNHAAVHHAGHFDIGAEISLGEDERRDVFALNRLADDLVVLRIFRLGLARRVERIAELAVPGKRYIKITAADQFGIAAALRHLGAGMTAAVVDREPLGRHAEPLRRELDENAVRFGGGRAQLLAAFLDAGGARGAALIHTGAGIAHHDL